MSLIHLSITTLRVDFSTALSNDRRVAVSVLGYWRLPISLFSSPTEAELKCKMAFQGATVTPIDFACDMTLLQSPSRERPDSLVSVCFILAIS